jgi:ADP-ribose pyrophosphatase YjhB (NUDIX family)
MGQRYKVFINDKPLEVIHFEEKIEMVDGTVVLAYLTDSDIDSIIEMVEKQPFIRQGVLNADDLPVAFEEIKKKFQVITAAGGVVYNELNQILFIKRFGKWDLPKGKVESGEAIDAAALREVEEECGVSELTIGEKLINTYHTYKQNDKLILKETHWFKMRCGNHKRMHPQTSEGITEVAWINENDLGTVMDNTYQSVIYLLNSISNK